MAGDYMNGNEQFRDGNSVNQELIGDSPAMVALRGLIVRYGLRKTTVLIQGESGTGKELVSHALHRCSQRAQAPFVAVNCGELAETLAESQLFGHERGSFSGAMMQHKGYFEQAHMGTLLLDEVGELSLSLQVRLLRALEGGEIRRVGGTQAMRVNVRVVAATNRDLKAAVAAHTFREDLYYRLKRLFISVPALRERRGDIPGLARHFVSDYARENELAVPAISPEANALLQQYDWPGNVRELQNVMGQSIEHACGEVIRAEHLPEEVRPAGPELDTAILTMAQFLWQKKREYAEYIVNLADGDYVLAAALLDIHPNGFHTYVRRLGLDHLMAK